MPGCKARAKWSVDEGEESRCKGAGKTQDTPVDVSCLCRIPVFALSAWRRTRQIFTACVTERESARGETESGGETRAFEKRARARVRAPAAAPRALSP